MVCLEECAGEGYGSVAMTALLLDALTLKAERYALIRGADPAATTNQSRTAPHSWYADLRSELPLPIYAEHAPQLAPPLMREQRIVHSHTKGKKPVSDTHGAKKK